MIPGDENVDRVKDESGVVVAPLNIIRTETVLSRLPIHNLAKRGKVQIHVVRKNDQGKLDLLWEVSYSEKYGQPRQLAYKVDTVVVNRRIDEEGRPLPKLLRLGSLSEICRQLGISASGKNLRDVKNAIHQNAGAYITAKLSYRTFDGGERTLEAGFTRYGVRFYGERLPDGGKADGVYLVLNDDFHEVLKSAPVRPLNYDYLKMLPPAAQRFYEIISFRVYAAFRNGGSVARLLYSDYCTFSAQQRYYDYDHFKKQMYKVHCHHTRSGYVSKVEYEPATDAEGKPDWMMCYTPGPRARAEYATFSRKTKLAEAKAHVLNEPEAAPPDPALEEFTRRGISEQRARRFVEKMAAGQPVIDQIEYGEYLISTQRDSIRNRPGFLISLVENNAVVPANFETSRLRKLRIEAEMEQGITRLDEIERELRYEEYRRRQIDAAILAMDFPEMMQIKKVLTLQILSDCEESAMWPNDTLDEAAESLLRAEAAKRAKMLTFQEFCDKGPPWV